MFFKFPILSQQYVVVLTLWGNREVWYVSIREATESTHEPLIKKAVKYPAPPCLKSLYSLPVSAVQVNDHITDWFGVKSGVRQGDNLSTTLFALFINDFAVELKEPGCGVMISYEKLCCLFYADEIVIIAENEQELQTVLGIIYKWTKNGVC